MARFKKGNLKHSGKTKEIFSTNSEGYVILENQNAITADDNPEKTKEFKTKAISATTTTCRVFELLKKAGIPVAYHSQFSDTAFAGVECEMIPLEVIARRNAVGSYGKRHPELIFADGIPPYRFDQLLVEFFLKTTGGELNFRGDVLVDGLDPKAGEEDPFIYNPEDSKWNLFHPKKPFADKTADLGKSVSAADIIPSEYNISVKDITEMTKRVFYVLEAAWANLGCRLIDFKIEFGIAPNGTLHVADVIDNDSWRLKDPDWNELSKQLFRDDVALEEVENKYKLVADLSENFRIPKQALVTWRGSTSDDFPELDMKIEGLVKEEVTNSGHKATKSSLCILSELMSKYPEGGVIITTVGLSNGLGPILSTHTSWMVLAIPATAKNFPEDVWSSLRMPSDTPMVTILNPKNAMLAALNILGQKSPLIRAVRQERIESLDVL